MSKTIKNAIMAAMAAAMLCAGTVSARQLSLKVQASTCSGFCSKQVPCANILGCACVFSQPNFPNNGTCGFIAAKPAK